MVTVLASAEHDYWAAKRSPTHAPQSSNYHGFCDESSPDRSVWVRFVKMRPKFGEILGKDGYPLWLSICFCTGRLSGVTNCQP